MQAIQCEVSPQLHLTPLIQRRKSRQRAAEYIPELFLLKVGAEYFHRPRISHSHSLICPKNLYAKEDKYIKPTYKALKAEAKDYDVYLTRNIPKAWHYNKKEDRYNRVGDMILVPHLPRVFSINNIKPEKGQHGFNPAIKDMHAIFYAWGPNFKSDLKIPAFENVNVYPLIAKILGLTYTEKIDGRLKLVEQAIKIALH